MTLLMVAAAKGSDLFVRKLLELDADVQLECAHQKWTAADYAAYFGHEELVAQLAAPHLAEETMIVVCTSLAFQAFLFPDFVFFARCHSLFSHVGRAAAGSRAAAAPA